MTTPPVPIHPTLKFHRDAFSMVFPSPDAVTRVDVLYGVGYFRDRDTIDRLNEAQP